MFLPTHTTASDMQMYLHLYFTINIFILVGLLEAHAVAPCHSGLDPRVTELVVDLSARHRVYVGCVTINVFPSQGYWKSMQWHRVILDEAHALRNWWSMPRQSLQSCTFLECSTHCGRRMCLIHRLTKSSMTNKRSHERR